MNRFFINVGIILAASGAPSGVQDHSKSCLWGSKAVSQSNLWGTRRSTIHQDSLKVELGSSTDGLRLDFALILTVFSFMLLLFGAPFRVPQSSPGNKNTTLWIMQYRKFREGIWIQKIPSRISKGPSKVEKCHRRFEWQHFSTTGLNNNLASN